MKIQRIIVGINETNTYILHDENTMAALIIDPGDEGKTIMRYIDRNSLNPMGIVLTHYHHDHTGAAEELKNKYNCPIYAHKKEAKGLQDPEINRSISVRRKIISITPEKLVIEGDVISIDEIALEVIHTPGHTPGGISLKVKGSNIVFTGDTIFSDDLGRTDLEGGSEEALKKTITNKVSRWSNDTVIYPGHGEISTMAAVKGRNIQYLK
ncbi:MBL fold metallo-hydrolase [Alkaliphilus peptidifermentans]|uniref:Glyoxylase, beta-lactamase superfamily II n=1 Tax=Alkaliphilus peptidifermentans DSM 18978 TaxID=1120976 RepID=A0A1G5J0U6_9FIRM|nr:MBL fold metallo-hydrolase [Alkaliphilus peptidifermentans]SCY81912.1 Glyoxylase, beta-lactamase superfamily II [Alkaliphilus peptidifermentans DSM 18978]